MSETNLQQLYDGIYAQHLDVKRQIDEKTEELAKNKQELETVLADEKAKGRTDIDLASVAINLRIANAELTLASMQMQHAKRENTLCGVQTLINMVK